MAKSIPFRPDLIKRLKDPAVAASYLNAALEEGDDKYLMKALRNVAEAQGGITCLAAAAQMSRTTLYRTLSGEHHPKVQTLRTIMDALGAKLSISPIKGKTTPTLKCAKKVKKPVTRGRPREATRTAQEA